VTKKKKKRKGCKASVKPVRKSSGYKKR